MDNPPLNSSPQPPPITEVCERALRLPCSPALLPRLIKILAEVNSSADEIAQVIMLDAALAASTLRLANSAFFNNSTPAETVADAVMRLGQRELYRLAALALVNRWETGVGGLGDPGDFCRHALCTALAAEVLAESTERVDPQTAYTAGLVCDLGKLAIAHACAPFYPLLRAHCAQRKASWSQAEKDVLGYTHGEVSAQLLRAWQFPAILVDAAEFCQRPALAPKESLPLLAHLHAAKFVAISFGPGVVEDGFLFELNSSFLEEWGFSSELLQESMTVVQTRAQARLQGKLTHGAMPL